MKRIKTLAGLQAEFPKLKSVWSRESVLNTQTILLIAELLTEIKEAVSKPKKKQRVSSWQRFFADHIKRGFTAAETGRAWAQRKAEVPK